jgi:SAM-dependent methyltransferase
MWQQVGPPLRPSTQDTDILADMLSTWVRDRGAPRVLILGVTPELYRLPWPQGTDVLAADRTRAMIDAVWPGPKDAVVCADWTVLPLADESRDLVLCDGGIHLLSSPERQRRLVRTLRRIVSPRGLCLFRLFVPPRRRETPGAVLEDLGTGKVPNINVLKLRLGMALQEDPEQGVMLGRVWGLVHTANPDFERLAARLGWPREHLLALNTYRNSETRYHFLGLERVVSLFCDDPGGFEPVAVRYPNYELGDRCPTLALRRAAGTAATRRQERRRTSGA